MKRNVKIGRWKLFVILALLVAMVGCVNPTDNNNDKNAPATPTTPTGTDTGGDTTTPTTYTITYALDGGNGTAPTQASLAEGATFTVADYTGTKADHIFAGWSDGSDNYAVGSTYTMGAVSVTLTARWLKKVITGVGNMILVEGGSFPMGTASNWDDKNIHEVTLSSFYMGETEVTQGQWKGVMGTTTPSGYDIFDYGAGDDYPLYYVSWYDAVEFCNALSDDESLEKVYKIDKVNKDPNNLSNDPDDPKWTVTADWTKNGYRLPTEAEWEYAAGGGAAPSGGRTTYAGTSDESKLGEYAWYEGNNGSLGAPNYGIKAVKTRQPNQLGLYDMSGNVWEWCWDGYGGDYSSVAQENPRGASYGSYRMNRGGHWIGDSGDCTVAYRGYNVPSYRNGTRGFRVARNAQ